MGIGDSASPGYAAFNSSRHQLSGIALLDPFCGCATALVAADRLQRQWVGIDLSPLAAKLVLKRLREDRGTLFDDVINREDIPARTDQGGLPNYKTHRHTLYGRQEGICTGCQVMFPFRNMTVCSAPGSLDTSLSHAAGLIEIAACHA